MTDYQHFLNRFSHVVGAISEDQNTVEITSTRKRLFGNSHTITSVSTVNIKATDANHHAFTVGDQVTLKSVDTDSHSITIRPKKR